MANKHENVLDRITSLCQELQGMILSALCETPANVTITENYKPPIALQLNHHLRITFARIYYGTTIFKLDIETSDQTVPFGCEKHEFCDWARTLSGPHTDMMRNVKATLAKNRSDLFDLAMLRYFFHEVRKVLDPVGLSHVKLHVALLVGNGALLK